MFSLTSCILHAYQKPFWKFVQKQGGKLKNTPRVNYLDEFDTENIMNSE